MPLFLSGSNGVSGADGTAALPAVQGTDGNTGVFFPAADQVAVAANGAQVWRATATGVVVTGTESVSGDLFFNSGYGSAARAFGCRAWVNFNGQGTVAIRASGNVSSITDNGVGDYTVNFTNAMPDANFSAVAIGNDNPGVAAGTTRIAGTIAANVNVVTQQSTNSTNYDPDRVCVAVFR